MASSTSFKASPSLTRSTSYEAWLKELQIRESFTDIPGDKRGSAVFSLINFISKIKRNQPMKRMIILNTLNVQVICRCQII